MPCEMQIQGQLAAIRLKAEMRDYVVPPKVGLPLNEQEMVRLVATLRGVEPLQPEPGSEEVELDDLKAELSAEAQRVFGTTEIVVSDVRFDTGSLEILVLLSTTAMVVKEFGSVAQGLREMARIVPTPIRSFVAAQARRLFGRNVEVHMARDASIEIRSGMLGAQPVEATRPVEATPAGHPPAPSLGSSTGAGGADAPPPSDRRVIGYLLASQVVMTLALVAIVLVVILVE